jgi:hypothetical protein
MRKKILLHENCDGLVETFKEKDYGLCQECGTEGYFVVTVKEDDVTFVSFTKVTANRK